MSIAFIFALPKLELINCYGLRANACYLAYYNFYSKKPWAWPIAPFFSLSFAHTVMLCELFHDCTLMPIFEFSPSCAIERDVFTSEWIRIFIHNSSPSRDICFGSSRSVSRTSIESDEPETKIYLEKIWDDDEGDIFYTQQYIYLKEQPVFIYEKEKSWKWAFPLPSTRQRKSLPILVFSRSATATSRSCKCFCCLESLSVHNPAFPLCQTHTKFVVMKLLTEIALSSFSYGYFKIVATSSASPTEARPGIFYVEKRAKWDAWSAAGETLSGSSDIEEAAKLRYTNIVRVTMGAEEL